MAGMWDLVSGQQGCQHVPTQLHSTRTLVQLNQGMAAKYLFGGGECRGLWVVDI